GQGVLSRCIRGRIVYRVHGEEQIVCTQVYIEACRSEVLADVLHRIRESLGNTCVEARRRIEQLRPVLHRPQVQERRDAIGQPNLRQRACLRVGKIAQSRIGVWHQRHVRKTEILPVAFVVAEQEELVLLDRAAQGQAEVITLELRNLLLIEVVSSVQRGIAQKLIRRPVQAVCAARRNDRDLGSLSFAIARRVGVRDYIELTYCVDAQQLPAGATRRHIDQGCSRVLDTVQQKKIVLWASPR